MTSPLFLHVFANRQSVVMVSYEELKTKGKSIKAIKALFYVNGFNIFFGNLLYLFSIDIDIFDIFSKM